MADPRSSRPGGLDDPVGETDAPARAKPDWDDIGTRGVAGIPAGDVPPPQDEPDGDLPEEDDDNAYQNSDEALPDDKEERAIARDPDREGGRFDEV